MTMSSCCIAPHCGNAKNLHPFPFSDFKRRQLWCAFVKSHDVDFNIEVHARPYLCNDHFKENDVDNFIEVQAGLARQ